MEDFLKIPLNKDLRERRERRTMLQKESEEAGKRANAKTQNVGGTARRPGIWRKGQGNVQERDAER